MNSRFAGQVVLITGASSGIGAELARQFAADGARVALAARDAGADQAAREGMGLGLEFPIGQAGEQPAAGFEEIQPGVAVRGVVQRLAQAGETAAAKREAGIAGGSRR
mgnify:CR=1 FL=1